VVSATVLSNRYRVVGEIGRGGMGIVWEAFDELLHRSVALKEVHFPPGLSEADRASLGDRTLREARAVAAVDVPTAVRVFDVIEEDGKPWIVMELIRGGSLTDRLRTHGPLSEPEVARLGLAVLEALEAAHAAGVLHRDVKPSNVLLGEDERIALTDFGIATVDSDSNDMTTTGVIVGSPSYIAPERAQGQRPTAATDLWALGATLWTAAMGRPPYDGPTAFVVLNAVANTDPPECTTCGDDLRDLLRAMMSREPGQRPAPDAIRQTLDRIAAQRSAPPATPTARLPEAFDRTMALSSGAPPRPIPSPPTAAKPSAAAPSAPASRRRGRWVAAGAAAALVVGGIVAALMIAGSKGDGSARHAGRHHKAGAGSKKSAAPTNSTAAVPAGFHRYTDPTYGWSVAVPDGWQPTTQSAGTQFNDPAGGRYLLIGTRYPAGSSAIGAWRSEEKSFRASHSNYQRIAMQTVPVAGASDAADWEFTYVDGGASLHAIDRGMVFGSRGYGVFFQTHTDTWDSSAPMLQTIEQSFRAGRTGA
jgi:serine/threonine protein kinase